MFHTTTRPFLCGVGVVFFVLNCGEKTQMKRNTKKEEQEDSSESEEDVPKKKLGFFHLYHLNEM
jgi:hypothetical protein